MNVLDFEIEKIIPYENNPRINDGAVEKVASSIREFGFKVPIILDRNNVIVAGHTRLKAAKLLGLKSVPCIKADDLTDQQIKAFRLADNKVSEFAEWDFEKLELELQDIDELEMADFGFIDLADDDNKQEDNAEELDEFSDVEKMEKHYGVPYQGNKSRIADIIISLLPEGERLVDLFGGGGAITHCAMLSGKWNAFLYNDINELITTLFIDAIHGKYLNEKRVITRDDFEELKNSDPFVKYIWSFGNNGTGYLWGKDIEEIKCQACRALLDDKLNDRRLNYVKFIQLLKGNKCNTLYRLQSLEHLEALNRLEVSNISYSDYEYKAGDVVYCDVPYEQKGKSKCDDYGVNFDSLAFYEWAISRDYQLYFSSYEISDERFYKKKIKSVQALIGANTNGQKVNEYLYSNKPFPNE